MVGIRRWSVLAAGSLVASLGTVATQGPSAHAAPRPGLISAWVQEAGIATVEPGHPATYRMVYKDPQASSPTWSGDGVELATTVANASDGGQTANVKILNRNGGLVDTVLKNTYSREIDWSPDGTKFAYVCWKQGGQNQLELCVYDVATGNHKTVTDPADADHMENFYISPSWSPDSKYIAFSGFHSTACDPAYPNPPCGFDELGVVSANGGPVTYLTGKTDAYSAAWSPDGDSIAYFVATSLFGEKTGIMVRPAPGRPGSVRQVVDANHSGIGGTPGHPSGASELAWSPDGGQLAFTTDQNGAVGGKADVFTVDAETGAHITNQTKSPGIEAEIDWAPPAPGCTIEGTPRNDTIKGTKHGDVICGEGGNDVIYGGGGNDQILGGGGNDTLYGQAGADTLLGEDGNDKLVGGKGKDTLDGGAGNDSLFAKDGVINETVDGGAGKDTCQADKKDHKKHC